MSGVYFFFFIFKSNLSSFALWKTSSFVIRSVIFIFNILLQRHVSNAFIIPSSFFWSIKSNNFKYFDEINPVRSEPLLSSIKLQRLQKSSISIEPFSVTFFFLRSPPPAMIQQPLVGLDLLYEVSRSHSDTPHSVGILWTSDRPVAETSTWQHTQPSQETYIQDPAVFEPAIPTSERP